MRKLCAALALGTAWIALPGSALAAAEAPGQASASPDASAEAADEGITVTARRRAESAQSVPVSLDVLTDAELSRAGLNDSLQLQSATPGLAISIAEREVNMSIRGIGNNVRSIGADPSNAVSLNGVYLPRAAMVLGQLFDVERVEVLKGPQGTLYGRNATGGAVNLIAKKPVEGFEADGYVGYGSYDMVRGNLAISGGNDLIQVRVAGNVARDEGYTYNIYNDTRLDATDYMGIRGTVTLTPTSNFKAMLFWQHSVDNGTPGYGSSNANYVSSTYTNDAPNGQREDARHIRLNLPVYSRRKGDVGGLTLDLDLGAVSLRSITGLTRYSGADRVDTDYTSADREYQVTRQTYRSWSQELQAFGSVGDTLDWLIGAYFYGDKGTEYIDYPGNAAYPNGVDYQPWLILDTAGKSQSQAVYGQLIYNFSPKFAAIVGARYTHDKKETQRFANVNRSAFFASTSGNRFTPSFQLQWKPATDIMLYANAVQGYKSGGVDGQNRSGQPIFGPENVWSYEAGIKSQFLNRRLTLNAAGFYMDYSNIQFRSAFVSAGTSIVSVNNEANAKIYGLEANLDYDLGNGLSVSGSGTYLHSNVNNYYSVITGTYLSGLAMPLAAKWSGTAAADYTRDVDGVGRIDAHVDYTYRSKVLFPFTYGAAYSYGDGVGLFNATLRWTHPDEAFYVEAIGRNLTDKLYLTNRMDWLPDQLVENFGASRTVEVRFGFKF